MLTAYSRSCSVESRDADLQPPAALQARPKGCGSTMTRLRSGQLKVEAVEAGRRQHAARSLAPRQARRRLDARLRARGAEAAAGAEGAAAGAQQVGHRRRLHAMTELIFIRHGETDWNRQQRFQGQIDVPLNATGHVQAQRLSAALAGERFDLLISSDLQRARQTVAPLEQRLARPLLAQAGWREQGFGVLEGTERGRASRRATRSCGRSGCATTPTTALPDGESVRRFHARVVDAVRALEAQATRAAGCWSSPMAACSTCCGARCTDTRCTARATAPSRTPASTACAGATAPWTSSAGPTTHTWPGCPSSRRPPPPTRALGLLALLQLLQHARQRQPLGQHLRHAARAAPMHAFERRSIRRRPSPGGVGPTGR